MENEAKLNKEQLEQLIRRVSSSSQPKTDVNDFVEKNLTPEQNRALNKALQNPELIKSLLSSPQAKSFINRLLGDG